MPAQQETFKFIIPENMHKAVVDSIEDSDILLYLQEEIKERFVKEEGADAPTNVFSEREFEMLGINLRGKILKDAVKFKAKNKDKFFEDFVKKNELYKLACKITYKKNGGTKADTFDKRIKERVDYFDQFDEQRGMMMRVFRSGLKTPIRQAVHFPQ